MTITHRLGTATLPFRCAAGTVIALLAVIVLSSCAYRIDVQQGNVVSAEQLALLKPGMTRDQVRYVLGTPLLTDVFHDRRWDYLFHLRSGQTGDIEQRKLAIVFGPDDRVLAIEADDAMRAVPPDATGGARAYDLTAAPAK